MEEGHEGVLMELAVEDVVNRLMAYCNEDVRIVDNAGGDAEAIENRAMAVAREQQRDARIYNRVLANVGNRMPELDR
jgi:uncharacterized protein YqfA (UPF0365 family)